MPETQLATALAQFGAAGLIGWMWLTERRAAAVRDRQLAEAHDRIQRDRTELDALLATLERNTRALAAVHSGQRRLAELLDRLLPGPAAPSAPIAPDRPERPPAPGRARPRARTGEL